MVTVELDPTNEDRVVVESTYTELYLVQQIPGVLDDRKRKLHTAPRTYATWMALQGIFIDQPATLGTGFVGWLNEEYHSRVKPALELRLTTDCLTDPRTPWDTDLWGFQRAGAAFLAIAQQAILADEMGTGKTVTSINALRRLWAYQHPIFPILCVVPNSTKGQWRRHWERWFPGVRVSVVGGSATDRRRALAEEADVYVIHWEAVQLHSRLSGYGSIRLLKCVDCDHRKGDPNLKESRCEVHEKELNKIPFRSIIVDEAHFMKNPEAKRTRAVWRVMRGEHVKFCYALTGTPIGDNPEDLWPIMHGLQPLEYPKKESYVQRYCLQSYTWTGEIVTVGIRPDTRAEFFGFFDARFRRMPKALVLPQLPPIVPETRECPMSQKQAKAYKDMERTLMAEVGEDDVLVAPNNLAKQTRLLQFASATCELVDGNVVMQLPSPKVEEVLLIMEEAVNPVLICAESRKLIELTASKLEEKKIAHELLVGGMTDDQREAVLRNLERGKLQALLFTMKAGGTGVDMTGADKMVRMDRSWSMLINYQTIHRYHRIGSERWTSLTLIDLVVPGTKEVRQFQVLGERMARLEEINRDKLTLRHAGRLQELATLEREEHAILNSTLLP